MSETKENLPEEQQPTEQPTDDSTEQQTEEELPQDGHLHGDHHTPEGLQSSTHWGLQAVAFLNMTWNVLQHVGRFVGDITKGIYRAVQPDRYVFFVGDNQP